MSLTELHRHLDASIRASTLAELTGRSESDIRNTFWLTRQMGSLNEVLDRFVLFQQVLKIPQILERVGKEAVEDAAAEGITRLELRYSPSFTSEHSGIPWTEAYAAFQRGVGEASRRLNIKTGLICIVSRGFGLDLAEKTIRFAVENKSGFIGVDLAGPEAGDPCRNYKDVFRIATDAGLPVTVHAGEDGGPENIREAIDLLGATRIGHGIQALRDRELIKQLVRDRILLETCPTSNYITRSIVDWADHPLPRLLEAGVPVSVSTDDPGIFGVTLGEERDRCLSRLGLTQPDLERVEQYARDHSFLGAAE